MAHEDRKLQILDAALDLLITLGPRKVNLEDVADRIGVTKTAVYHYFPRKEAIFRAVMTREVARALENMEQAVAQAKGPDQKLKALIEARFHHLQDWRKKYTISYSQFLELDALAMEAHSVIGESEVNLITQILQEGKDKGLFNIAEVDKLARIVLGLFRGVEAQFFLFGPAKDLPSYLDLVTGMVLDGLRTRDGQASKAISPGISH